MVFRNVSDDDKRLVANEGLLNVIAMKYGEYEGVVDMKKEWY